MEEGKKIFDWKLIADAEYGLGYGYNTVEA